MTKSCTRCTLVWVLEDLLDDGSGTIRAELRRLTDALTAAPKPDSVLSWLKQPRVRANLKLLAGGTVPVTHAGLNTLTPWRSAAYLRDLLIECGTLPQVDRSLECCRQLHFDRWAAEHRDRPYLVRRTEPFLRWCMEQRLLPLLAVARVRVENPAPIGQRARLDLIRDLLTGVDYSLVERIVALLVILYAQPATRIVLLKVDDVLVEVDGVSIRLGDPPSAIPEPFSDLLLRLLSNRPSMSMPTNVAGPWLLPGRRPGNPMAVTKIRKRIIGAGGPNVFARTAALRHLVLEAPAPVVAGMLGFYPVHTAFVTKQAGAEWNRYASGDHAQNLDRHRPQP